MTSRERTSQDQVTGTDIARKDIARTTQVTTQRRTVLCTPLVVEISSGFSSRLCVQKSTINCTWLDRYMCLKRHGTGVQYPSERLGRFVCVRKRVLSSYSNSRQREVFEMYYHRLLPDCLMYNCVDVLYPYITLFVTTCNFTFAMHAYNESEIWRRFLA